MTTAITSLALQLSGSLSQLLTPTLVTTLTEMGGGGIAGGMVGYGLKKLLKFATKLVGAILALFFLGVAYLDVKGIITVNWTALSNWLISGGQWILNGILYLLPSSQSVLSTLPISGSIIAGFAFGFQKG